MPGEIDEYLAGLDETKRRTLEQLRPFILDLLPEAEEGVSYAVPKLLDARKAELGL